MKDKEQDPTDCEGVDCDEPAAMIFQEIESGKLHGYCKRCAYLLLEKVTIQ